MSKKTAKIEKNLVGRFNFMNELSENFCVDTISRMSNPKRFCDIQFHENSKNSRNCKI